MLYVVGEETDEKQHFKYHAEFNEGVRWSARLERPRKYFVDGDRILAINPTEQKPILDSINKLLKMSDSEMSAGDDVMKLIKKTNVLLYIYVTQSNHIVGYICAELIKEAFNLVDFETSQLEREPVPAECGVLYLWVHPRYRRKKYATWLTDVARANLIKDRIIYRSRVAVCDPTDVAIPYFKSYLRNKRPVKVYQQN